jgi:hypothetical protein
MLGTFLKGATYAENLLFVGGDALSSAATQTPTFSLTGLTGGIESSPASGDIVIACVAFKNGTDRNIQCTTSGYTEVADLFAGSTNSCQLGVYYKVLSSAETSVSFNLGVSPSEGSRFAVHVWRNLNSTPLDATTTTATNSNTGVPDAPSITTVTSNAIVIAVGAAAGGTAGLNSDLANLTVPSGMGNFFQSNSAEDSCIGIASIRRTTTGSYNPPAFGGGNSSTRNSFCAATLALRPI